MPSRLRRPLVVANWKMHKSAAEAEAWVAALAPQIAQSPVEVGVAAPFVYLDQLARLAPRASLRLAGQNCHQEAEGAFTGEVSAAMLRDVGCDAVVVGHSERRRDFGESDALVGSKMRAALGAGLLAIVCVGESLAEREAGRTSEVLAAQLDGAFAGSTLAGEVALAYEPLWAIGSGRNATPEQASEAAEFLRSRFASTVGAERATRTRILYGGSVTGDNAGVVLAAPGVDGALVGGASLSPSSFAAIVAAVGELLASRDAGSL